jgi:hypothetical protein
MSIKKEYTGLTFGKLLVIKKFGKDKYNHLVWKCKCSCGKYTYVKSGNLPKTKSCGCLREEKMSRNLAERNGNWKGYDTKINKVALHNWIRRRSKKPDICPRCKKRKTYDLTNKGIYNRDLKNWEWLCRHCHMKSDGRLNNLKQYEKK